MELNETVVANKTPGGGGGGIVSSRSDQERTDEGRSDFVGCAGTTKGRKIRPIAAGCVTPKIETETTGMKCELNESDARTPRKVFRLGF